MHAPLVIRRSSVEKPDQTDARRWRFWHIDAQAAEENARPPLQVEFFRVLCGVTEGIPLNSSQCEAPEYPLAKH
jgi:hypothetical protein